MFGIGQKVYVKVSNGYIPCIIIGKNNSYYKVKSNDIGFGCSENRIITVEQYEEMIRKIPKQTFYRPPGVH